MTDTPQEQFRRSDEEAARRGHPSYVWRAGQERRLALVRQWARLDGARILDDGCGVGMYTTKFCQFSPHVKGVEIDPAVAAEARARTGAEITVARGENLPFDDASFDVVFSHEVIEHVDDDRQAAREMVRVLAPGGRIVIFCPNRLYPFETHGHFWRGKYHFGNTPLINYLPDPLRNRLAPHVRAYTGQRLRALFTGLPVIVIHHQVIYPGFDNIVARRPAVGRWLKRGLYAAEHTRLQVFGLSHF
ncbi:MAG: methyltransferase domain-containing protein, partial [Nitrososphaerales archaeon]